MAMQGAPEATGDTGGPEPTKPKRFDWNRPMVVGVVGALIAAGGAIAAAVITSSSSHPAPTTNGSKPSVDSVTFGHRADGALVVAVAGTAQGLPAGDLVYAVAEPVGGAPKRAGVSAEPGRGSGTRWFASTGSAPNTQGRWTAHIVVNPAVTSPLTIEAAEMQIPNPGPPSSNGSAPASDSDPNQSVLEQSGPQAARGKVSSPVTATPQR